MPVLLGQQTHQLFDGMGGHILLVGHREHRNAAILAPVSLLGVLVTQKKTPRVCLNTR